MPGENRRQDDMMTDDERLDRVLHALMHNDDPEAVAQVKHLLRCLLRWYDRARVAGKWSAIGFFSALGGAFFTMVAVAAYQGMSDGLRALKAMVGL